MRAGEFDHTLETLDEIAVVKPIKNWFDKQIQRQKMFKSAATLKRLVNSYINYLIIWMGRYGASDWPLLTMRLLYTFIRLEIKLSDQDIAAAVNKVMAIDGLKNTKDKNNPKITIQQIKDQKSGLLTIDLWPKPIFSRATKTRIAAEIAEKIITEATIISLTKNWEKQAGVEPETQTTTSPARDTSGKFTKKAAEPAAKSSEPTGLAKVAAKATAARTAAKAIPPSAEDLTVALTQLGAAP